MRKSDVIEYFGSVKAVANALELTSQAVSMWPETVPRNRQWQIDVLTEGKLKAQRERPTKVSA
ncbi:Cro/CI family transcriptional regulator [Vreelandella venusta]|uniref:Cro/CI family transcriptional regulator n=1 Tax=Vreelandella venusta TaxID=44935 RepID=UPI0018DA5AC8|nr:helix-turn-helix domain-containing protein [Halomonas venusta]